MKAAALALVVMLLAGCLDPGSDVAVAPRAQLRFPDAEGALLRGPPASGAVAAGSFFAAWAAGDDYPTWHTEPFLRDTLVDEMIVTAVLRATGPVTTSVRFPDLMAYGGSGDAWDAFNSTRFAQVIAPGEERSVTIAMAAPPGGLWVPAGERLGLKLVPVMTQGDANDIEFLVGPGKTMLAWKERAADFAARPGAPPQRMTGDDTGSAYAGDAAPPTTYTRVPVEVSGSRWLVAWMNVTSAQGVPDVDLFLEDSSGAQIAGSGTPTPREMLRLGPGTLPTSGTVTLVVASYGSAHASFELTWQTGAAPASALG